MLTERIISSVKISKRSIPLSKSRLYWVVSVFWITGLGTFSFPELNREHDAFTLLHTEDFESDGNGTRYRANQFDDGANDFWIRTNVSPESGSSNNQTYSGWTGTYHWNGEDIVGSDNPISGTAPGYLTFQTLNVSAYASGTARVTMLIAADINGSGTWEASDVFAVEYAFDTNISTGATVVGTVPAQNDLETGSYAVAGAFYGTGLVAPNNFLQQDTDLSGTGDGASLNNTFTSYTFDFSIPASASTMSVRIRADLDQGGEVVAFDHIQIFAEPGSVAPTSATVAATAFLQGAWNGTSAMNTSINSSIPAAQPYHGSTFNNHAGTESASAPGMAVDWVLVELREAGSAVGALNSTKVGSAAGFLMSDGSIKATDGTSNLTVSLSGNTGSDFYVVIYHRNHLPIMSASAVSESSGAYSIDLSVAGNVYKAVDAVSTLSGSSKVGMHAGDTNGNGTIGSTDLSTWRSNNGAVYNYAGSGIADFNLDGVINAIDRNDFHQKNTSKTRQVPTT